MELSNGKYRAKAREWAMGETSKGSPQVAVLFDLLDEGHVGTQLAWYGYFSEKTFAKTIEALKTCGWQGSDLGEIADASCGLDVNEVQLVVENEQKQNEDGSLAQYDDGTPVMFPRVRWVNSLGGAGLSLKAPMQSDKLKAFAAEMKGRILALSAGKPPSGPPARPAAAKPPASPPRGHPAADDIPF